MKPLLTYNILIIYYKIINLISPYIYIYSLFSSTVVLQFTHTKISYNKKKIKFVTMLDWAPVLIGWLLFILLSPGLLFQLPGNNRGVDFGGFNTNGKAILVHTIIFFVAFTIFVLAVGVHIFTG